MVNASKLTPREFAKERRLFEKSILTSLKSLFKLDKWLKKNNFFFKVDDHLFWSLTVSVHQNSELISVDLDVKPMSIDPILWNILGLSENNNEPKSFRSNGAFTCSSLPIANLTFLLTPENIEFGLKKIQVWLNSSFELGKKKLKSSLFSDLLFEHQNHKERGAYAISLVCSLIDEESEAKALEVAKAYENGELESCLTITNFGNHSFHYCAITSLEGNVV